MQTQADRARRAIIEEVLPEGVTEPGAGQIPLPSWNGYRGTVEREYLEKVPRQHQRGLSDIRSFKGRNVPAP